MRPITVVVLTFNEEKNLPALLTSVAGWARDVFIVDSGSTDRTLAIAAAAGATVVPHAFETHAIQWQWALQHLPIATDWVLALDADQSVTPALRESITTALDGLTGEAGEPAGFFVARRQVFRGRWIRHGGYYPKFLLKLFHRAHVSLDASELVDHHFHVNGRLARLAGDLVEDNRNEAEIFAWTAKHNRYAVLQARHELRQRAVGTKPGPGLSDLMASPDARTRWLKARWATLPLFLRPVCYVVYRYILRLGFLDGREGFIFHVLQAFWYRLLVDINIDELRRLAPAPGVSPDPAGAPIELGGVPGR